MASQEYLSYETPCCSKEISIEAPEWGEKSDYQTTCAHCGTHYWRVVTHQAALGFSTRIEVLRHKLIGLCTALGIDYKGIADQPFEDSINMTFTLAQEPIVDLLVRKIRATYASDGPEYWLSDYQPERALFRDCEQMGLSIHKSFIRSHQYWSLEVSLTDGRFSFTENTQP